MSEGNNIDTNGAKLDNLLIYVEELDAKMGEIIEKLNEMQIVWGEGFGIQDVTTYDS